MATQRGHNPPTIARYTWSNEIQPRQSNELSFCFVRVCDVYVSWQNTKTDWEKTDTLTDRETKTETQSEGRTDKFICTQPVSIYLALPHVTLHCLWQRQVHMCLCLHYPRCSKLAIHERHAQELLYSTFSASVGKEKRTQHGTIRRDVDQTCFYEPDIYLHTCWAWHLSQLIRPRLIPSLMCARGWRSMWNGLNMQVG